VAVVKLLVLADTKDDHQTAGYASLVLDVDSYSADVSQPIESRFSYGSLLSSL
jgi:hypothetical protein